MSLFTESGGTLKSRIDEARRIALLLCNNLDEMTPWEQHFIEEMSTCTSCSPKQIFKLRDIKDKYL
jgi:hypothetical protein